MYGEEVFVRFSEDSYGIYFLDKGKGGKPDKWHSNYCFPSCEYDDVTHWMRIEDPEGE